LQTQAKVYEQVKGFKTTATILNFYAQITSLVVSYLSVVLILQEDTRNSFQE
jgi:hypothetical protein